MQIIAELQRKRAFFDHHRKQPQEASTAQPDSEREALQRAKDDQATFEAWSKWEGGLNLKPADGLCCEDFRFPATYYYSNTETAWRAWANKPARAASGAHP